MYRSHGYAYHRVHTCEPYALDIGQGCFRFKIALVNYQDYFSGRYISL